VTIERAMVLGRATGVVILAVMLQAGAVSSLSLFGVRPELALLLAVAAGVAAGPDRGAVVGFSLGLAYDLFLQTPLGMSALIYALVAHAAGTVQLQMASQRRSTRMLFLGVGTAVGVVAWALIGRLLDTVSTGVGHLAWVAVVAGVVNSLVGVPAIRLWRWVFAPEALTRPPG